MKSNCWAILLVAVFALPCIQSCQQKPKETVEYISNDGDDLADFHAFYDKFHEDSVYQLEHIRFPLEGMPGMADSLLVTHGRFFYKKAGWKIMKPVDWKTSGFKRVLEPTGLGIVNEYICSRDKFCTSRRFAKFGDEWYLIYYSNLNYRPDLQL